MSNDWVKQEYSSKGYRKKEVKRVLYVDNIENPIYKFKEEIDFIGENNKKPYAICIGLNPAKAQEELDDTNKRLIDLLQNDYSGYYLFNIYPEITPTPEGINKGDKENSEFLNKLKRLLKKRKYKKKDIVLFFGRTLYIPNSFVELIKKWSRHKRRIYITCHKDEFIHPGANTDLELKEFKMEYMRTQIGIKIK